MSGERHHIAAMAAEAAKNCAEHYARVHMAIKPAECAKAAKVVTSAYRKAIADLAVPIKTKEQE